MPRRGIHFAGPEDGPEMERLGLCADCTNPIASVSWSAVLKAEGTGDALYEIRTGVICQQDLHGMLAIAATVRPPRSCRRVRWPTNRWTQDRRSPSSPYIRYSVNKGEFKVVKKAGGQ
jgi:hypothetical protein